MGHSWDTRPQITAINDSGQQQEFFVSTLILLLLFVVAYCGLWLRLRLLIIRSAVRARPGEPYT